MSNRFANLRTMVDRFLVDTCTIRDLGTEPTFDPDTFTETINTGDVLHADLRCRLRPLTVQDGETGAVRVVTGLYQFTVPVDITDLKINQTVTMVTSDDAAIVGRIYRIDSIEGGTDGAYRRCTVADIIDLADWAEGGS